MRHGIPLFSACSVRDHWFGARADRHVRPVKRREFGTTVPPQPEHLQFFVLEDWEPLVEGEEPPQWNSGTIPGVPWRAFMARVTFNGARSAWWRDQKS